MKFQISVSWQKTKINLITSKRSKWLCVVRNVHAVEESVALKINISITKQSTDIKWEHWMEHISESKMEKKKLQLFVANKWQAMICSNIMEIKKHGLSSPNIGKQKPMEGGYLMTCHQPSRQKKHFSKRLGIKLDRSTVKNTAYNMSILMMRINKK